MRLNYFKVAYRNMKKSKTFSIINILGFAFGIAICMMIVLYLMKEYSYDRFNTNADYIYRLTNARHNYSSLDYRVKQIIMDNYSQVENASILNILPRPVETSYKGNAYYVDNLMSTDNEYFEMFTVEFIYGNPDKPFQNIHSVVLSENTSHLLFGNENPLGKEISIFNKNRLTVTGVIKDMPDNSSIKPNIIVNADNSEFRFNFSCDNYDDVSSHRWLFNIYLQLNKNVDPKWLAEDINNNAQQLAPFVEKIGLLPLKEIYLYDYTTGGDGLKGNPSFLNLLTGIALLILLLAIINYVNLTVARQNKRYKEAGIRKTIGASRKNLIIMFLTESILITMIAFGIALVIMEVSLPLFNIIVDSSLGIKPLLIFPVNIMLIISIVCIGIIAGIVPSVLLSSYNPSRILRGGIISSKRKIIFRASLIVFQFTISTVLIFCLIVVYNQINFVKNQNTGFDKEQLLRIDLPSIYDPDKALLMLNRLKLFPEIKNISRTGGVPGDIKISMGSGITGKDKPLKIITADSSFLQTFGIQLIKGRNLLPGDYGNVCMLNEAAYKYFGWTDLKDKRYNNVKGGGIEVIGVVKDFNYSSLHDPIEPMCIVFIPWAPSNITLRIAGEKIGNTVTNITGVWKEIFPDYPLKYQFYDEWFDAMYRKEERLAQTIGMFAMLAISVSCLGILGLAIFTTESRSKELGIRKVHGAGIKDLIILLNVDYIKCIVISFIITCPIAWYVMRRWLEVFAYRIDMTWWMFALAGGIAIVIALATVCFQVIKAATANPVEALRYE